MWIKNMLNLNLFSLFTGRICALVLSFVPAICVLGIIRICFDYTSRQSEWQILLKLSLVMLCVSLTCSMIVWWADENWTFESQVCTCTICSVPVYTKRAQQSLHLTYKAYSAFPGNGAAPPPSQSPNFFSQ